MIKIKKVLLIILSLIIISGCNIKMEEVKEEDLSEEVHMVKVIINDKEYEIILEDSKTTRSFVSKLPGEFNMSDLNGNEKYVYLDYELPTATYSPGKINKGDVMLYGDDCLVIFYESFDTSYSYTRIGHIDNLPDLGHDNIKIRIEK